MRRTARPTKEKKKRSIRFKWQISVSCGSETSVAAEGQAAFESGTPDNVIEQGLLKELAAVRRALRQCFLHERREPLRADEVLDYMEENLRKKNLLSLTARHFNYSVRRMETLLREETGYTYGETVRRFRLEKARGFVILTDMPLEAVGRMIGYRDHSSFARAYKKRYGLTPSEDRRQRGPEEF